MSKAEGRSGVLSLQSAGWSKFECKLDKQVFTFVKSGGMMKKTEAKSIELTKSVVVREYPRNFFKTMDFPFSITIGDVTHVFRSEKESERTGWLEVFEPLASCHRVLAFHWASKCPKGTAVSKVFKPRFFILHDDRLSYYKEETTPEAGSISLKPGVSDARVLWQLAKKYTISISPEPGAPLPLHMCFNLYEHYEKWIQLLVEILQLDYTPPLLNPNLFQPGRIVKEGLLEKKGERNKAWQTRFFLLKTGEAGGDSTMEYRKFNQFGKVCGDIEISDRMAILAIPKDERDHQFALTSKVNGRIFYLAALGDTERKSWIETLATASRTPKFAFSLCEGFLQKRGAVNTAYKERYFVLLFDRLLYYKNKRDEAAAGEIIISQETTICLDEDQENGFTLSRFVSTPRLYVILAPEVVSLRYWMEKIAAAIEGKLSMPADPKFKGTLSSISTLTSSLPVSKPTSSLPAPRAPPRSASSKPPDLPRGSTLQQPDPQQARGSTLQQPDPQQARGSTLQQPDPQQQARSSETKSSGVMAEEKAADAGGPSSTVITEACVCGVGYRSADEKACCKCGVVRPNPLHHTSKAAINAPRKRPIPKGFKMEEARAVRVVRVDETETNAQPKVRGFGGPPQMAAPQRCSVEGCGKWEFQDGVCKSHLSSNNSVVPGKPLGATPEGRPSIKAPPRKSEIVPQPQKNESKVPSNNLGAPIGISEPKPPPKKPIVTAPDPPLLPQEPAKPKPPAKPAKPTPVEPGPQESGVELECSPPPLPLSSPPLPTSEPPDLPT